ncbi:MAG: fimbrillin family protein [Bacteroidaceae bacterium]|nr:fimbrillin family protein [Bacteroidaceae bacterium]
MKKSYLIFAVAALLIACSDNDTVKQVVAESTPQPMSFSAYAGKITKGSNSNQLYDFYNAFTVYGFKTVTRTKNNADVDTVENVFYNEPVEHFATDAAGDTVYKNSKPSSEWFKTATDFTAGWYYEDVRFWDKLAKQYDFFAVAPYVKDGENSKEYDVAADYDNVKIKSATAPHIISDELNLAIENNVPKSKDLSYAGFDRDYMVATKITRVKPANGSVATSQVDLAFKHILAKLNVKIVLSESYIGRQELVVNELKINGLAEKGYYVGNTDLTGWTITNDRYARDIKEDYSLTDETTNYDGYYWLETLMFPQEATCKVVGVKPTATGMDDMYLYINYHIGNENYVAYYDFASIWMDTPAVDGKFNFAQGNEYNLTITVGPEPIKFKASVSEWTTINGSVDL